MKVWQIIRHFRFLAPLTLIAILAVAHTILLGDEIHSIDFHIRDYSEKVLPELNAALTKLDSFRVREILGLVRDDRAENLIFDARSLSELGMASIELGQLRSPSIWVIESSLPLRYQGADLGRIRYDIDLLGLSRELIVGRPFLYVFLALVFAVLILASNYSAMQIIYRLEILIRRAASRKFAPADENSDSVAAQLPSFMAESVHSLLHTIEYLVGIEQKAAAESAKNQLALQVAHDIRSPLSVMNLLAGKLEMVPEEIKTVMLQAVGRINQIASDLVLMEKKSRKSALASHRIRRAVEELVREKRLEVPSEKSIEYVIAKGVDPEAKVHPEELMRILSNLFNNAVEAISSQGSIAIEISEVHEHVVISIRDNGKGIPQEVLARLGEKGESHGKSDGGTNLGVGLYHAKSNLLAWGGSLTIESQVGSGTTIRVLLRK